MHRLRLDADSSAAPWRDHDAPGSILSVEQFSGFDAAGYCVVKKVLTGGSSSLVEREIDALEQDRNDWLRRRPTDAWSAGDVIDFAPGSWQGARCSDSSRATRP